MKRLEVSTEEAWHLSREPDDADWPKIRIADRGTAEFRDFMHSVEYERIEFATKGDPFASALILNVWAPWGSKCPIAQQGHYVIEYEGAGWRRIPPDNTGYWQHRIADGVPEEFCLVEQTLAKVWLEENKEFSGLNHGQGILQDLMLGTLQHEHPEGFDPWLTNRERKIVATIIQWLGTNCGRAFLSKVCTRMGRPHYPFEKADKTFRVDPDLLQACLHFTSQILGALPTKRDWLDPNLEQLGGKDLKLLHLPSQDKPGAEH